MQEVTCIRCPRAALPEGGPLGGPRLPRAGERALGTEATLKHSHYAESADIVTARYQSLASWGFDPGIEGEGGGKGGGGNCTPD